MNFDIFHLFDIRADSTVPIYEQILSQLIYGIASGTLPPGTEIPGVRTFAQRLRINPNTASKAFQELERRGILAARRGLGMEVTADGPKLCRQQRQVILRDRIRQVLREAALALPVEDIRKLVEDELARTNGRASSDKGNG